MKAVLAVVASAALTLSTAGFTAGISTAVAATPDPEPGDVTLTTTRDGVDYQDASLADEDTTTVAGTLRITSIDRVRGGEYAYAIETADGDIVPLDVETPLPLAAANGAIEAEVVDPGSASAPVAEATVQTQPEEEADPVGVLHRAYVVLVSKTGTLPSEAEVSARLDGSVIDEWVDEAGSSIGGFTVAGTTTLAATLPSASSTTSLCNMSAPFDLWAAGEAQFPGVDFEPGSPNHLVMVVSGSGCGTSGSRPLGMGTVGDSIDDGGLITLLWDPMYVDATGVHELGHNFGLGHANVKACEGCAVAEYLDVFSVMGFGMAEAAAPALDTEFRDQLGLTRSGETEVVDRRTGATTVTRTLAPRGSTSGLRGLEVVDPVTDQTYWVELRAGGGADRDAGSAYARSQGLAIGGYRFEPGVTITQRGSGSDLDLLPHETGSPDQGAWKAGDAMVPATGGMSIAVDDVTATSATVTVALRVGAVAITTGASAGKARVGAAAQAVTGDWADGTIFTYRWTVDGTLVSTRPSYVPTAPARGHRLGLTVRATTSGVAGVVDRSAQSFTVGYGIFATSTPRISGTVKVGRTLKGVVGAWRPAPTSYRWQYYSSGSWRNIAYATKTSYKVSSKYKGKKLRFRVKGNRSGYTKIYRYSSSTTTVKR